jgi:hypothetical protein
MSSTYICAVRLTSRATVCARAVVAPRQKTAAHDMAPSMRKPSRQAVYFPCNRLNLLRFLNRLICNRLISHVLLHIECTQGVCTRRRCERHAGRGPDATSTNDASITCSSGRPEGVWNREAGVGRQCAHDNAMSPRNPNEHPVQLTTNVSGQTVDGPPYQNGRGEIGVDHASVRHRCETARDSSNVATTYECVTPLQR